MNIRPAWLLRPVPLVVAATLAVLAALVVLGEVLGWPFLAAPLQRKLSEQLGRPVSLLSADPASPQAQAFSLRFIGGLRLKATQAEVAAPAWSASPHLLQARDLVLGLGYTDLWRAYRGRPLHIRHLQATVLDVDLQRMADGRASWQPQQAEGSATPAPALPTVGVLQLGEGRLRYQDEVLKLKFGAELSVRGDAGARQLQARASGSYEGRPLNVELQGQEAPSAAAAHPLALQLKATIGQARLEFDGRSASMGAVQDFAGHFGLSGPSLAAVGDALGVTLPTTGAFRTAGTVVRQQDTWLVRIDDATVGASRLKGAFRYDAALQPRPLLAGRLRGSRLLLDDLGPVVGTTPLPTEASSSAPAPATSKRGRVLPDRPFDLAALRAMDANVLIDIADVDLGTRLLEPLRPVHAHLQLRAGVLSLDDLDARTGEGRIRGALGLDGRGTAARWQADLRWDGIRLERWVRQVRDDATAPPYVSGRWSGQTQLKGQGRSTAQILASLQGRVRSTLRGGALSHLLIEAAGLDVAESLGRLVQGDEPLKLGCAAADLALQDGVLRPGVFVLDTVDSTAWIDGSVSLARETLDLRVVVTPKDFSPLTLRTPLRVGGTFAKPDVAVEYAPLGMKIGAAVLLGLINPLAALIPLLDPGNAEEAQRGASECQALMQRARARG